MHYSLSDFRLSLSAKIPNYQSSVFRIPVGVYKQGQVRMQAEVHSVSFLELSEGDRIALTSYLLK